MIYWDLKYRPNVDDNPPWLSVVFSDEKHALASLRKFYGDRFDKLKHKKYEHINHQEWTDESIPGMRGLVAMLDKVEVHPHARAIQLPTEEKAA